LRPDKTFGLSESLHALLTWGPEVEFVENNSKEPVRVLDVVLGLKCHPSRTHYDLLFYVDADGFVRSRSSKTSSLSSIQAQESHYDQAMATFGQLGLSLDQSIRVQGRTLSTTLSEPFNTILQRFELGADEPEWTILSIAYYLPPAKSWTNRWGTSFSMDDLAAELLKRPYGQGTCSGTHTLFTICTLLRVDENHSILTNKSRQAITDRLRDVKRRLEEYQLPNGAWSDTWATNGYPVGPRDYNDYPSYCERLRVVTGHHLEWIAIAPLELRPSEQCLLRALNWCFEDLRMLPSIDERPARCPPTHTMLAVYRNFFPERILGSWLKQ
jgi:hypothetical protein